MFTYFSSIFNKNAASAYQEHLKSGLDLVVGSFSISSPDKPNLPNLFRRYCVGRFIASKEWSLIVICLAKSDCDLLRLREYDKMNNAAILFMIEQKLPDKALDKWTKEVSNKTIGPRCRFSSMMRLLGDWRKRIE